MIENWDVCTCLGRQRGGPGLHHEESCPLYQPGVMYANLINDGSGNYDTIVIAEVGGNSHQIKARELFDLLEEEKDR